MVIIWLIMVNILLVMVNICFPKVTPQVPGVPGVPGVLEPQVAIQAHSD